MGYHKHHEGRLRSLPCFGFSKLQFAVRCPVQNMHGVLLGSSQQNVSVDSEAYMAKLEREGDHTEVQCDCNPEGDHTEVHGCDCNPEGTTHRHHATSVRDENDTNVQLISHTVQLDVAYS